MNSIHSKENPKCVKNKKISLYQTRNFCDYNKFYHNTPSLPLKVYISTSNRILGKLRLRQDSK